MFFRNRLRAYFTRSRVSWMTSSVIHSQVVALLILELGAAVVVLPGPPAVTHGEVIYLAGGFTEPEPPREVGVDLGSAEASRPPEPPPADLAPGGALRDKVRDSIAAAEALTPEQRQESLTAATQTLNSVSNVKNVDAISAALQKSLGTEARASKPAKQPPPGDFDFSTAQLYDVRREANEKGGWKYTAILLDKDGRTSDAELDEPEGKQAFETFELIKSNPLLERVYRGLVTGLMDKLLKDAAGP